MNTMPTIGEHGVRLDVCPDPTDGFVKHSGLHKILRSNNKLVDNKS